MKKYLFIVVLAMASVMVCAQPRAIGGRLGAFNGFSYQHGFGDKNMLEVELGWAAHGRVNGNTSGTNWVYWNSTLQAAVTYDWIDPFSTTVPWDYKGEWHWYMGAGGAGGYGWRASNSAATSDINWGFLAAAGRVGIEYDFWFPLQLSLDYRPTIGVGLMDNLNGGATAGCYWDIFGIALGVRYKF